MFPTSDAGFGFAVLEGASSPDMESSYGGGLLDMVKGGAGRLFSNLKDNLKDTLKDTSSKVMQSVARYSTPEAGKTRSCGVLVPLNQHSTTPRDEEGGENPK